MKTQTTILLASLLLAIGAQADTKVAYVDVQKAIEQTNIGKKAKEEMKKEGDKKSKELEKKKAEIEKMREDIDRKRTTLSQEALTKRVQELQEEMQKFNQSAAKAQGELQKKESDLLEPIVKKIKAAIEKIAKEKNIDMVIQSNTVSPNVVYASPDADLTGEVVKNLDK